MGTIERNLACWLHKEPGAGEAGLPEKRLSQIHPTTLDFLRGAASYKIFRFIEPRQYVVVRGYYSTEGKTLSEIESPSDRDLIHRVLESGMTRLWQHLPPSAQEQFPLEELPILKAADAHLDPTKKVEYPTQYFHTAEVRARISKAVKQAWTRPEYRDKITKAMIGRTFSREHLGDLRRKRRKKIEYLEQDTDNQKNNQEEIEIAQREDLLETFLQMINDRNELEGVGRMYDELKMSYNEITKISGKPLSSVHDLVVRYGCPRRPQGANPQALRTKRDALLTRMKAIFGEEDPIGNFLEVLENNSYKEITKKYSIPTTTIASWRKIFLRQQKQSA